MQQHCCCLLDSLSHTLEYLITVGVRLLILGHFSFHYAFIRHPTLITFCKIFIRTYINKKRMQHVEPCPMKTAPLLKGMPAELPAVEVGG